MGLGFRLAVLLVVVGTCPAEANEAAAKSTEPSTLEAYGSQNAHCAEWSDGCAVCVRHDGTKVACSLPGIACQPRRLACQQENAAAGKASEK